MASQSDMVELMTRIEAALTQQASIIASMNRRIDGGDQNIEQRFAASENRMAGALAAMGNALQQLASTQQQIEANLQAAVPQATTAQATATAASAAQAHATATMPRQRRAPEQHHSPAQVGQRFRARVSPSGRSRRRPQRPATGRHAPVKRRHQWCRRP